MGRGWRRAAANRMVGSLPRFLRDRWARRQLRLDRLGLEGLHFKPAETHEEFAQAFQILHDRYVAEGLMRPTRSRQRVTLQHALPTSSVLIGVRNGRVAATVSLLTDSALGLPLGKALDYAAVVPPGARVRVAATTSGGPVREPQPFHAPSPCSRRSSVRRAGDNGANPPARSHG